MTDKEERDILQKEVTKLMDAQLRFYDSTLLAMIPENYSNDITGNILLSFIVSNFSTNLYAHLLLFTDPTEKLDMILMDIKRKLLAELKQTHKRKTNYAMRGNDDNKTLN